MSKNKLLLCLSGSIAAYKACELVSLLRKNNFEVKVLMTKTSEKFVGKASLQALSGNKVLTDDFLEDQFMTHIKVGTWCDLAMVYPASAQTVNSLACGVGHELLHSMFLAFDFNKPFLIAPAMNTRMLENPITKKSLKSLKKLGCKILPTEKGTLACGEMGAGRLIDPEKALSIIKESLSQQPEKKVKKILITAGGTRETIDGVRTLTNMSTGKTGATLADYLHERGHQVLLLTSTFGKKPNSEVRVDTYDSFREIYNTLKALSQTHQFDMILHAAAISDYSIAHIETPDGEVQPGQEKMSSQYNNISIRLKRNEKILPRLKDLFGEKTKVVGFKLTSTESKEEQARAIFSLFTENAVDYVIHNDMNDINKGERKFLMTSKDGQQNVVESLKALGLHIGDLLDGNERKVDHDLMS